MVSRKGSSLARLSRTSSSSDMLMRMVRALFAMGCTGVKVVSRRIVVSTYRIVLDQELQIFYGRELVGFEYRGGAFRILHEIFGR